MSLGDVQLQLVVLGLHHVDARALGGGFHFTFALFLVLRPDIGAQTAHGRASDGAHARVAPVGRADGGAG